MSEYDGQTTAEILDMLAHDYPRMADTLCERWGGLRSDLQTECATTKRLRGVISKHSPDPLTLTVEGDPTEDGEYLVILRGEWTVLEWRGGWRWGERRRMAPAFNEQLTGWRKLPEVGQ